MMSLVSCWNLQTEHPIFVLQFDNPPLQRIDSSFHVVVHLCGIAIVKFVSRVMLHCCTPQLLSVVTQASENRPNRLYEIGIKVLRIGRLRGRELPTNVLDCRHEDRPEDAC